MAIIQEEVIENGGLVKEIDAESVDMIMQVVQSDLYTKPIESSIRETFSNAYDAVKEKKIAISILSGKTEEADHFVNYNSRVTKSSKFNKDYYDLQWLDPHSNRVNITYTERDGDRDLISISDYGVGLGNGRLAGFMRPGYSSKRLSKELLGRYGLGSKSPLATNIEYYVLESWYNGMYTKFMIYDNFYKCVIGANEADLTTEIVGKRKVGEEIVDAVEQVHWTKTDRKNGVTLSFDVKAHNKGQFMNAVKDQLLYFKEVLDYYEEDVDGNIKSTINFASILHETSSFVISSNDRFTSPHILVNNVNYGYVDFDELGINRKYGNVAIKAGASDVDVTASRESVKWTEKTRKFVLEAIDAASDEAGIALKEELANYINPVERHLAANSTSLLDRMSGKNTVLDELKKFSGEVRVDIKMDIDPAIPEKIVKGAGLRKNEIAVRDMMIFMDDYVVIHNINVSGNRVKASRAQSIRDLKFDTMPQYRTGDNVRGLDTLSAHYLTDGNGELQYVFVKSFNKTFPTSEDFANKPGSLKAFVKSFYKQKVMHATFISMLKTFCHDVSTMPEDVLRAYKEEHAIQSSSVIIVKDGAPGVFNMDVKSKKQTEAEEKAKAKREKSVLPYKMQHVRLQHDNEHYIKENYSDNDAVFYRMGDAVASNFATTKATVYYGTTKDRALLDIAGYIATVLKLSATKFTDSGLVFIQIAEANIKHFKQIPNIMHVNTMFKESHDITDNVLKIEGSSTINKFLTNYRIQQALKHVPETFRWRVDSYKSFLILGTLFEDMEMEEEIRVLKNIQASINSMPFIQVGDGSDIGVKSRDLFRKSLRKESKDIDSLFDMLENFCILQDTPEAQYIDDDSLKQQVAKFDTYHVNFYDKQKVDEIEKFAGRYAELIHLAASKRAVVECSDMDDYTKQRAVALIDSHIGEFFSNISTSK